jgi:valyl-tRNA synthetase
VTEEIYQTLGAGKLLMIEKWPVALEQKDFIAEADMETIKEIITIIRNLRSENKIEPVKMISVVAVAGDKVKLLTEQAEIIKKLARLERFSVLAEAEKPANSVGAVAGGIQLYLELAGLIDLEAEKKRIEKEITESEKYIKGLEAKLGNKEFLENAPEEIIAKEKEKLEIAIEKIKKLKDQLNSLV